MAGQPNQKTDKGTSSTGTDATEAVDFEIIELLFFAYRDFTSDPDVILEKRGFGARIIASCTSSIANRG